jgi:hypothetical protein
VAVYISSPRTNRRHEQPQADERLHGVCSNDAWRSNTYNGDRPTNTSEIDGIFLSENTEFRVAGHLDFRLKDESGTEDIWYNALWYSRASEGTLFPLHEACLEISCRAFNHLHSRRGLSDSESALKILYHFLNERFLHHHRAARHNDPVVNDIFDLRHRSKLYGPRSVIAMNRLEWWGGQYDVRINSTRKTQLTSDSAFTQTLLMSPVSTLSY